MTESSVLIRTSERATYRRCRQRWVWKYRDKLVIANRRFGALDFGSLVHLAFEQWYVPGVQRNGDLVDIFTTLFDEYVGDGNTFAQWDEDGDRIDARELGVAMMTGYVELYGSDPFIEIIAPEMTFDIDVYTPKGRHLGAFVGKFDAVARYLKTGRLVLLEHKTAKTIDTIRINSSYGEQGMSYLYAAQIWLRHIGVLSETETIDGVLFNWLRKALPDERPTNEAGLYLNKPTKKEKAEFGEDYLGTPSKRQPSPLFRRDELIVQPRALVNFERRLRHEMIEMKMVRSGKLPVIKSPSKDCGWDCDFKEMCELHEMGADWETMRDMEFTTWDPYSDHEIENDRKESP